MSNDNTDDEIPAIVIDNGSFMCKAGFAGDDAPRVLFQSVIGRTQHMYEDWMAGLDTKDVYVGSEVQRKRDVLSLEYPVQNGIVTNWDDMEKIWHHAIHKELNAKSEKHPVVITEPPLNPKTNREKMMEVMFESFNVPAFHVSLPAMLSMYSYGRGSGIMLDCGHGVTHVVPVYEGYAFKQAFARMNFGGGDLTNYLLKTLNTKRGHSFTSNTDMEDVRKMKERLCYTATDFQEECKTAEDNAEKSYELPDGKKVFIGEERFRCPEGLFEPAQIGKDYLGLAEFLYSSLMKVDVDSRRDIMCSVLLSGGSTMFSGVSDRLQSELVKLVPKTMKVRVVASPERKLSVWIGGSIFGSLSTFTTQAAITKQEYEENGKAIVHTKCY